MQTVHYISYQTTFLDVHLHHPQEEEDLTEEEEEEQEEEEVGMTDGAKHKALHQQPLQLLRNSSHRTIHKEIQIHQNKRTR